MAALGQLAKLRLARAALVGGRTEGQTKARSQLAIRSNVVDVIDRGIVRRAEFPFADRTFHGSSFPVVVKGRIARLPDEGAPHKGGEDINPHPNPPLGRGRGEGLQRHSPRVVVIAAFPDLRESIAPTRRVQSAVLRLGPRARSRLRLDDLVVGIERPVLVQHLADRDLLLDLNHLDPAGFALLASQNLPGIGIGQGVAQ